ncbi:peptidylprolyl isomerase [Anaerovorax sp. IOR16]|uniref:peptidylprolyl isomerase n=1 Tax=Anaerovorax sp. IOR16 TaxID=2773458 RepID=UPI0019D05A39|nr:peptidylprolyl isomerase [Anaerovorax sp. IOR16]
MKSKRWMMILLTLIMVISFTACGSKADTTPVANVGDTTITRDQLSQYISWNAYAAGYDLSQITEDSQKDYLASLMLEQMVADELIKQYSEKNKLDVFTDTYDEDLKNFLKSAKENADSVLKSEGITEDTLVAFYNSQYYAKAVYDDLKGSIEDLEGQAKAYYTANSALFTLNDLYLTASHILVDTEKEAKEIKAELDNGADFAELAKEKSKDPGSKDKGGELGTFKDGDMIPEFWEGAKELKVGEISEPVKSSFGYHIIKLTDRKEPGLSSFEEVKTQAEDYVINQKYQEKVAELKKEIKVEYLDKKEIKPDESNTDNDTEE